MAQTNFSMYQLMYIFFIIMFNIFSMYRTKDFNKKKNTSSLPLFKEKKKDSMKSASNYFKKENVLCKKY